MHLSGRRSRVGATLLPAAFLVLGLLYLANSVLYCLVLKHRVIIDVMSIAIGFVLRLLAGCAAIGVFSSSWLLICGFSLAMLLGFGKRTLSWVLSRRRRIIVLLFSLMIFRS